MSITHRGPGKWFRKGISLLDLMKEYPDEATAEQWFVKIRWPNGKVCPVCGSKRIADRRGRLPVPFHCRDCKKDFSVKTGTVMHKSKLGLRKSLYAIFLMNTSLKGVSSMKLARELDVTQKTAWYLGHRIRKAFSGACSGARLF